MMCLQAISAWKANAAFGLGDQFPLPYKKEYGDGILVSMAFVKDGRLYSHNARIMKPAPEEEVATEMDYVPLTNSVRDSKRNGN